MHAASQAEIPAVQLTKVRNLLRRLPDEFDAALFAAAWERWHHSPCPADILATLAATGLVEPVAPWYRLSAAGQSLCNGSGLQEMSPKKLSQLLAEIIAMASCQNMAGHWLFSVRSISIYKDPAGQPFDRQSKIALCVDLSPRSAPADFSRKMLLGHKDGYWICPGGTDAHIDTPRAKQLSVLRCDSKYVRYCEPGENQKELFVATAAELQAAQRRHDNYYSSRMAATGQCDRFGPLPADFGGDKNDAKVLESLTLMDRLLGESGVAVAQTTPGQLQPGICRAVAAHKDWLKRSCSDGLLALTRSFEARCCDRLLSRLEELPEEATLDLDRFELEVYCAALQRGLDQSRPAERTFILKPFSSGLGPRELAKLRGGLGTFAFRLGVVAGRLPHHAERARQAY